jgi:hypothetical protein
MSVDEYRTMLHAFVDKQLSAPEFREWFVHRFLSEPETMERRQFVILQDLFEDVESYRQDWPPPASLAHILISEDELRHEAQVALDALEKLEDEGGTTSST